MEQSKIFTEDEIQHLNDRLKGSRKDKYGTFANRVKPKIIELLEKWFPIKRQLKKAIEKKRKIYLRKFTENP